ncbi:MAG: hypothetical protein EOM24_15820 [Chloroflexia bacterium]|nr:hypothetical protein [Chloroflexia bacterium]
MTLEERVAILEQELLALKRQRPKPAGLPWWEQISGVFADTPAFDETVELGRQDRASQFPQEREQ